MPTILADKVCAMAIVYSVTAALAHRERTGEGEHIEVPMVDVMRSFTLVEHGAAGIHAPYQGRAGYRRLLTPERRPQATADGWVDLLPYSREHYDALFSVHLPEMVGDERYQTLRARIDNSDLLYQKVREVLVTDTTVAWEAFCASRGIPFSVVTSLDDLVDAHPDAEHPVVGTYKSIPFPIRFANAGVAEVRPAPLIDEHAAEIRTEIDDRRRHAGHCQT